MSALVVASSCGSDRDATQTEQQPLQNTTGSLTNKRAGHIAAALPTGKVLVAGGWTASGSITSMTATAELYSPTAGTWSTTTPMSVARENHSAIRLPNGRVLVVGGRGPGPVKLASCELFDPSSETWLPTGSLLSARETNTLSLLQNGRVLAVGQSAIIWSTTNELYDPVAGTWASTGSLSISRNRHSATVLANGKVLVAGGLISTGTGITATAELYDPVAGTWTMTGSMGIARFGHSAHLLANGRVLVIGGYSGSYGPFVTETYDPATGAWTPGPAPTAGYLNFPAVTLNDGSIIVAGGSGASDGRIERFSPTSGTWTTLNNLVTPRSFHSGTLLTDGRVVFAGGTGTQVLTSAEVFSYSGDAVAPTATLSAPFANGATIHGTVSLTAQASDNVGVTKLQIYAGSTLLGVSTTSPLTLNWNTASVGNGTWSLTARAYDAAGNIGTSTPITVIVSNTLDAVAPTATLTAPFSNGATVRGSYTLTASATDNVGVTKLELYFGASLVAGATATSSMTLLWNTTFHPDSTAALVVKAYDAAGNLGTSAPLTVAIRNTVATSLATYNAQLMTPACLAVGAACDTGSLVTGRASLGPESNQSNTLAGSRCADGTYGVFHGDESLDAVKISTVDGTSFAPGKTVRVEAKVWAWSTGSSDYLDVYSVSNASSPTFVYVGTIKPLAGGAQTLSTTFTLPTGSLQAVRVAFRYSGSASPCTTGGYNDRDDLVFAVGP